ncbi:uncharacterized protein TrAFT101_003501 [Trichoderma asperellum]|uniref:uncharacterized protein n=1 Tax=Trichoderma asperellum TaxID=101201 RepID=UPI0033346CC1|nr:hypothetical protein TrAFT101_003501 [Trichoderma asperellum]
MGYMATDPYPLPIRDTESKWSGQMDNLQPLVCEKIVRFSPGVGKEPCLSENVFELFGRPSSPVSATAPPDTGSPQRSIVCSADVSAGSRSLGTNSDISALVRGILEIGFAEKVCLGQGWSRMLAEF